MFSGYNPFYFNGNQTQNIIIGIIKRISFLRYFETLTETPKEHVPL